MDGAALDVRISEVAAQVHACTASLAVLAAEYDDTRTWATIGMQSCAHWLSISTGFDLWNARELLRVGHALRDLPQVTAAFTRGDLSFDKVRALCSVACEADEGIWLDVALQASGAQLSRICRQFRRSVEVDDPNRAALQRARRRLVSWWLDDGMLALHATLPPEEGRIVLNAIEAAVVRPAAQHRADDDGLVHEALAARDTAAVCDPAAEPPPEHPHGALRADALVRICGRGANLAEPGDDAPLPALPQELVVHVDLDTLTGADLGGRCHIEDGPAVSRAVALRMGCDASVTSVLERDGAAVDVHRTRRVPSGRIRRLVQLRDGGCRYPGCNVPARDADAHHIKHWAELGQTVVPNLITLCRFHHGRHHEGAFTIAVATQPGAGWRAGDFTFTDATGRPISAVRSSAVDTPHAAGNAAARDGGRRFDLDHAVQILASGTMQARRRHRRQSRRRRRHGEQRSGP